MSQIDPSHFWPVYSHDYFWNIFREVSRSLAQGIHGLSPCTIPFWVLFCWFFLICPEGLQWLYSVPRKHTTGFWVSLSLPTLTPFPAFFLLHLSVHSQVGLSPILAALLHGWASWDKLLEWLTQSQSINKVFFFSHKDFVVEFAFKVKIRPF